jgi:hypothetical protein
VSAVAAAARAAAAHPRHLLLGGAVAGLLAGPVAHELAAAVAALTGLALVRRPALALAATAVVLGGGAAVVVHHRAASHAATTAIASPTPAVNEAPELATPGPGAAPLPIASTSRAPSLSPVAPSRAPLEGTGSARLTAESALLTAARAELRNGDAKAAQSTLARMQAEFPHGVLWQEREVLAIEALAADGKTEVAARRARAFIAAHPESPHSSQLGRFLAAP